MSPADRANRPDAGFTVLEVLIALAIVAVSIVAIASVMSTNSRGVTVLENHVALVETAQTILATGIAARGQLAEGTKNGRLRDFPWQVDVTPIGGDWDPPAESKVEWIPKLVRLHVRGAGGGQFDLATVRLTPRHPK